MRLRVRALIALLLPGVLVIGCTSPGGGLAPTSSPTAASSSAGSPATSVAGSPPPTTPPTRLTTAGHGSTDWPMYHGDPLRSGRSTSMPAASGAPTIAASLELDGAVYASPIVVDGAVIAATENDSVYGLTREGGQVWRTHLGEPSPAAERPCGNIDPLGITGTPIYSPQTGSVYVVAEYTSPARHELVALDPRTGAVQWRRSVDLPGRDAVAMQERGALAISGGRVWVPFGGLAGDCGNYVGRVVGVPLDGTGSVVHYDVPTDREAGSWAPPGPTVLPNGDLLVATGNGASGPGDPYDTSDSVLRLDTSARLLDSFSPESWAQDNAGDVDLGSVGPAVVGPRWLVQGGKSDRVFVLRQDHLGGIGGQVSVEEICPVFGGTAVDGDVVYLPCTDGVRAVRVDNAGQLRVLWQTAEAVTGSPVVGGGRVWSLDPGGGVLHALDPATGRSLGQVAVGRASRFATPAISGGLVLVPTLEGVVFVRTS